MDGVWRPDNEHRVFTDAHEAARVLSGKWIITVLVLLSRGPKGHNDLARATGLAENKPLDRALQRLVSEQLVDRTVYNAEASAPRVRYRLTSRGRSVLPIIETLANWWQDAGDATTCSGVSRSPTGRSGIAGGPGP